MSELFRLEKVVLNNFKLFGDSYTVNFNSNDLVVFDGPNGHGKTTIYDAIELSLTGEIRRFSSTENLQSPSDVVVAHKNRQDCFVRIELKNNIKSIVIERHLKEKVTNSDKKISNFKNLWNLYLLSDGERRLITQSDLNKIIGNENLSRDFTLFHYVEQEDTAHFLKHKKEKERAEALSVLFGDTIEMQNKLSIVSTIIKRIEILIGDKKKEKNTLELRGNINISLDNSSYNIEYSPLFMDCIFEWDKDIIQDMTSEKRDRYLLELHSIESLIKYKDYFLSFRKNLISSNQKDVLTAFISHYSYIEKFDLLKKESINKNIIDKAVIFLQQSDFSSLLSFPALEELFSIVKYLNGDEFILELNNIVKGLKYNNDSSSFIIDLLKYREILKGYISSNNTEDSCLLCGTNFEDNKSLLYSVEQKEIALRSILSNDSSRLQDLKDNFIKLRVNPLLDKINEYLNNINAPSKELLLSIENAILLLSRMHNLSVWLDSEGIEYSDLLLDYYSFNSLNYDVNNRVNELSRRILDNIGSSPVGYDDMNSNVNFNTVFSIYFKENSKKLRDCSYEKVRLKMDYINQAYIESISNDIKTYKNIIIDLNTYETKRSKLIEVRKYVKAAISKYQKHLIKDIEVPFYIYSGKVLQAHQVGMGNGIFIKDKTGGNELKNIRFVSNWLSDHDVINTMSSGQIAAIVISLYLALNKVYARGLSPLLIDDPVQTMDEINMISLVELLRNEFSNRQIILSTHEEHVSRYFMYKFLKYKKNVRQIKLLDKKEYQLSN